MIRFQRVVSALLAALLLLIAGSSAYAQDAEEIPTEPTSQQAEAITILTEKALEEIAALRASAKNPWVVEMLENTSIGDAVAGEPNKSGAIKVELTVLYPLMISGVDAKAAFDGSDPEAFVRAALDNALSEKGEYVLNATVTFREDKDPTFKWHQSKGFSGFRSTLTSKAKAAVTSFSSKPMVAALSAFLFQHPVRGARLNLEGGLRAMKLSATAPGFDGMHRTALRNALVRVAYEAQGPNTDTDTLYGLFDEEIAAFGAQFAKAKKATTDQSVSLLFNPLALLEGREVEINAEAEAYRADYNSELDTFQMIFLFSAKTLPNLPALEMPETGQLVGGGNSGVKIVIRAKKGDGNRMISFTKDGEMKSLCFIRDGERVTIYIPSGTYTVKMGSGSIWYGEEELFGPDTAGIASYSTSQTRFSNPGKGAYWTFTLSSPETGGNMDAMDRDDLGF